MITEELTWDMDAEAFQDGGSLEFYYGQMKELKIYFIKDGSAFTGFHNDDVADVCVDNDWTHEAAEENQSLVDADPNDCTVDASAGTVTMVIDCFTTNYEAAIEDVEVLDHGWFEIQILESGETQPSLFFQFDCSIRNALKPPSGSPTSPGDTYTETELDNLLDDKLDKVGSDDAEITDATKGFIMPLADGTRIRFRPVEDGGLHVWYSEVVT